MGETIILAGGCFWCTEAAFAEAKGVLSVESGYTGGHVQNPTYEQVCRGDTGHTEALKVEFSPDQVSLDSLLEIFWRSIDPLDAGGQFFDRGSQYRTAIFYADDVQKQVAEASKAHHEALLGKQFATTIEPAQIFWPAEDYHQDYFRQNALRYEAYAKGSGRQKILRELWHMKKNTP